MRRMLHTVGLPWNHVLCFEGEADGSDGREAKVGDLEWAERPGRTFELHLDVEPAYQRQGVGRAMVVELERVIADREPMSLYSFSAADNELAYQFFTALGFRTHRALDFYGRGRDAWFYVKPIGEPK